MSTNTEDTVKANVIKEVYTAISFSVKERAYKVHNSSKVERIEMEIIMGLGKALDIINALPKKYTPPH